VLPRFASACDQSNSDRTGTSGSTACGIWTWNTNPWKTELSDLHQQLEIFFDTDPLETFFSKLGLDWFSHWHTLARYSSGEIEAPYSVGLERF
jgi:hypothetical protein